MVKIGSVTDEIFLIWTNVARTNVAWTNVTVYLKSVQDSPMNLRLKFRQNWVSNSRDITDIEFLRWWGGVGCAKSFSCQTQLSLNCVRLFWSCFGVVVGVLTIMVSSNRISVDILTNRWHVTVLSWRINCWHNHSCTIVLKYLFMEFVN